jgi:hypothetical protein
VQTECSEIFEEPVGAEGVGHNLAMVGSEGVTDVVAEQIVAAGSCIEEGHQCLHYPEHSLSPLAGDL